MIQPLSVVCYEHSLKHNVTPREIRCCIQKDQIKRRKIKILLVVTIMYFFASLVMDKTNETLGRTGGGGKSLKATPFSFFYILSRGFCLGTCLFQDQFVDHWDDISSATDILNGKRGVVDNSICIKMYLVNSLSQNYRARNGCKAT